MKKTARQCVVFFIFSALSFASPATARSGRAFPGLEIGEHARGMIAVTAEGGGRADAVAVRTLRSALRPMPGLHSVTVSAVPSTGCERANAAAVLDAVVTVSRDARGARIDVDLQLFDCAGWPVSSWDVQRFAANITPPDVALASYAAFDRFRLWVAAHPLRAAALLDTGAAYLGGSDGPTYYYQLAKTADGELRAVVRPGGPAYAAGLRGNDIVEDLDGRPWWDYGTYQAQARASDGTAHTLRIRRDGIEHEIPLTVPLSAPDEAR